MNIEKWIEDNQQVANAIDDDGDGDVFDIACVDVEDLRALLKTHAIVPRDMPYETLAKIKRETPATVRKMLNIFIEESERDDGCDI